MMLSILIYHLEKKIGSIGFFDRIGKGRFQMGYHHRDIKEIAGSALGDMEAFDS